MTELASRLDTIKVISFVFIYLVLNSKLGTKNPVLSYSISPAACESRWTYYVFQVARSGEKRMVPTTQWTEIRTMNFSVKGSIYE